MIARLASLVERLLVPLAVVIGAIGVALPGPGRALDRAGAIEPTLALLVLTAGLAIKPSGLAQLRTRGLRVTIALVATTLLLPLLGWALGHATSGGIRQAMLAVGVAPSEVASIALTGLAGGEISVAATLLIASTLVTVVAAGPILSLLAHVPAHPSGLLVTLVLVVALPLVLGTSLHPLIQRASSLVDLGRLVGSIALLALLFEVASQVDLQAGYVVAAGLLLGFLVGASALGAVLTIGLKRPKRVGLLLPVAMRDFAIAAGIATAAFGPTSAGALGIYGLLVLLFGALVARWGSTSA